MGNSESYKQVATTNENDENRDDLMFVFHTTDDDSSDRVVHENESDEQTWPYMVTCSGRLIAERRVFNEPIDNCDLFKHVRPGDAVEFVKPGKRLHWAIYIGDGCCVHLKRGRIAQVGSEEVCLGWKARLANNIYKLKSLPAVQIINNARTQVGKPLIWSNSECFAMWCRTGRSEFTNDETQIQNLDSKSPKISQAKYVVEIQKDEATMTRRFRTLSELTQFRRNVEKFGKERFEADAY